MVTGDREHFIPRATDPGATWGEFPPEDERLLVSHEVMALLEADFPEAAALFQVDPMWLEHYRYPQRIMLGVDVSRSVEDAAVAARNPAGRLWVLPEQRNHLEGDIRADERKLICSQEGHGKLELIRLEYGHRLKRCVRCDTTWEFASCGCPVQYPPVVDTDCNQISERGSPVIIHRQYVCPVWPK